MYIYILYVLYCIPTFLSEVEPPVPTHPVVYSPVPTISTLHGNILGFSVYVGWLLRTWSLFIL